jgi:hypothetical protein
MHCPNCGTILHLSATLSAAISDMSRHVDHMMAHLQIAQSASPDNKVDRAYEMRQMEFAAKAQLHLTRALGVVVDAFESDAPPK